MKRVLPFRLVSDPQLVLAAVVLGLAPLQAAAEPPPAPAHPIVGSWSWQVFGGPCRESLQYRANGSMRASSGEALTAWTYHISATPGPKGFYKLVETTTETNGKADCSGDVVADDNVAHTRYIQFSPARDRLIVCRDESLTACFGPLTRASNP